MKTYPRYPSYIKVRDEELVDLEQTKDILEWMAVHDAMKISRGMSIFGSVIPGWQEQVIDSGLLDRTIKSWINESNNRVLNNTKKRNGRNGR